MAEVTLKKERPALTVNVGDEQYKVPLTFTRREIEQLGKAEDGGSAVFEFFAKYLGEELYEQLGDDDLQALVEAWQKAREEMGAPSMGESQASPKS